LEIKQTYLPSKKILNMSYQEANFVWFNEKLYFVYFRYTGALNALTALIRERGVLGMWKGWLPNVQRGALVNLGGEFSSILLV